MQHQCVPYKEHSMKIQAQVSYQVWQSSGNPKNLVLQPCQPIEIEGWARIHCFSDNSFWRILYLITYSYRFNSLSYLSKLLSTLKAKQQQRYLFRVVSGTVDPRITSHFLSQRFPHQIELEIYACLLDSLLKNLKINILSLFLFCEWLLRLTLPIATATT